MKTPEERAREIVESTWTNSLHKEHAHNLRTAIATEFRKYEERIEGLRKALEVYSAIEHWGDDKYSGNIFIKSDVEMIESGIVIIPKAGKHAREALSKDDEASK